MKLGEIIKTNHWLSVELTFLKLYPDQETNISAYKRIYAELQNILPVDSWIEIVIEQEVDEDNNEYGVPNVYGNDHQSTNEFTDVVALEFTKWNKWLGMKIQEKTIKDFTELEIIAHCLFEMTFVGYDEEKIQDEFERIKGIADEYKNLSPEDKKLKSSSLDDLLKDLSSEE